MLKQKIRLIDCRAIQASHCIVITGALLLSACAHVPGHKPGTTTRNQTFHAIDSARTESPENKPFELELTVSEQITPRPNTEQIPVKSLQPSDPLLADISESDVRLAASMAQGNYRRSWKTIQARSRYVRSRLLTTLNQLKAPESLQMIPAVESTYDPYAVSHTGAIGLWQLMPSTARFLGVHSGRHRDGRREIATSTRVAVRYLLQLHDRFHHWPLALAAYNIGPNALARRLKKQPWRPADGLNRMPVPSHARRYVQHIIGLVSLWRQHQFSFPEPVKTKTLSLQTPVDMHRLATLGGMAEDDIFRYNPCLNSAQYLNQRITIAVPATHYDKLRANIANARPQFVNTIVKKGDTLWSIARAHQISVARIKQLNRHLGKYVHIGQTIKVSGTHLAGSNGTRNPLLPSSRHRIRYRVRHGDSLWRIANRFGTSPKAIAHNNRISMNRTIRVGDTLLVYSKERPS